LTSSTIIFGSPSCSGEDTTQYERSEGIMKAGQGVYKEGVRLDSSGERGQKRDQIDRLAV
jgi:uncharacterized protein YbbK (DUF523 family)